MKRLSESDVKKLAKAGARPRTSHSVRGITVSVRTVSRSAKTGQFVVTKPSSGSKNGSAGS
jgi:hypothetical protein